MRPDLERQFMAGLPAVFEQIRGLFKILRNPPWMDIVEWIEGSVCLPKSNDGGGGPLKLYGYQKSLARLTMRPEVEWVVCKKGIRVGFTQLFAAITAFIVLYLGRNSAWWQPTDKDVAKWVKRYWKGMIEASPKLQAFVRIIKKGDSQDTQDEFTYTNGATLFARYATQPDSFRSISVAATILDEPDAEGYNAGGEGKSQGEKIKLAWGRSRVSAWRKQFLLSSPLRSTSRIHKYYLKYTQHHYNVRCPHCKEVFYMQWGGARAKDQTSLPDAEKDFRPGVRYEVNDAGVVDDAYYICDRCFTIIDEVEKFEMDRIAGDAVYADDDPTPLSERLGWQATQIGEDPRRVSVHCPAYISMFPGADWKVLGQEEQAALKGTADDYQEFVNNTLGEIFEGKGVSDRVEVNGFAKRRTSKYAYEVPSWAEFITMSFDFQQGWKNADMKLPPRVEGTIMAHGRGRRAAVVGYVILQDDEPFSATTQRQIDQLLERPWKRGLGQPDLYVVTATLDAGWEQERVIAFCRGTPWRRKVCVPTRGLNESTISKAPIVAAAWEPNDSKNRVCMVGTRNAKDRADQMIHNASPGPNHVDWPTSLMKVVPDYFSDKKRGLFAERRMVDAEGREYWDRKTDMGTGEAWDTFVGNVVAIELAALKYRRLVTDILDDMDTHVEPDPEVGEDNSLMMAIQMQRTLDSGPGQKGEAVSIVPPGVTTERLQEAPPMTTPDVPRVGRSKFMASLGY